MWNYQRIGFAATVLEHDFLLGFFSTGEVRTQPKLQDDLVGGLNPSEKYEFVSWEYVSQLNGKS